MSSSNRRSSNQKSGMTNSDYDHRDKSNYTAKKSTVSNWSIEKNGFSSGNFLYTQTDHEVKSGNNKIRVVIRTRPYL